MRIISMNNKVLGGALIIAGTAVGAGMLAMPLTSAAMGFTMTFLLLFTLWALLTYTSFLFIELHQYEANNAGIATLASRYFGENGRLFVDFILLLFMYALLTAYMTGSGGLLESLLPTSITGNNPLFAQKLSSFLFAASLGIIVTVGVNLADVTNRFLFAIKILVFIAVLYLLFKNVSFENLLAKPTDSRLFLSGASIFFMAFGFHICIPTVNEMLNGDIKLVRRATFIGTFSVLVVYLVWQLTTHGVLNQRALLGVLERSPNLPGLIESFKVTTGSRKISEVVRLFSILAITTSYIGVSLGLANAVRSLLLRFKQKSNRGVIGLLTFTPPIVVGLTYPNIFLSALAYAGVIFAFIGVILPVILVFKSRKEHPNGDHTFGGTPLLIVALILAAIIIITPFLVDLGYLPPVIAT